MIDQLGGRAIPMRDIFIVLLIFMFSPATTTLAQQDDVCHAAFLSSVESATSTCASSGEGDVCLANSSVQGTAFPGSSIALIEPGDVVDAASIQSLTLVPFDPSNGQLSIVITRVRAELAAGQTAKLIFFGGLTVENLETPPVTIPGRVATGANIRDLPSAQAALLGSTPAGSTVNVDGRLSDESWYRIILADNIRGWILGEIVDLQGDVSLIETIESSGGFPAPAQGSPLRAFRINRKLGSPALCGSTSSGGLLVQIEQGIGEATLQVNGAQVHLTSTVLLQAESGGTLTMNVLDGLGRLTTSGITRVVPTGARTQVALDGDGMASGEPSPPEPYNANDIELLPLALLDRPITPPPPINMDVLTSALGVPPAGRWNATFNMATLTCPDGFTSPVDSSEANGEQIMSIDAGGDVLVVTGVEGDIRTFSRSDETSYRSMFTRSIAGESVPHEIQLTLTAPAIIEGQELLRLDDGCTITIPFQMTFTGE